MRFFKAIILAFATFSAVYAAEDTANECTVSIFFYPTSTTRTISQTFTSTSTIVQTLTSRSVMAETLVYGQILKTEYPSSRVDCKGWGNEDCVKSVFLIPTVTTVLSYSTKLSTVTLTRAQYDLSYLKSTTAYTTAYATTITSKKRHC